MAENIPFATLIYEVAVVSSKTHVCNGRISMAPLLDRKSFKKHKNSAFESSSSMELRLLEKQVRGERSFVMLVMGFCGCFEDVGGVGNFSVFDRDELVCPSFRVVFIVFCVSNRDTGNLEGHLGTRFQFLISSRVLP